MYTDYNPSTSHLENLKEISNNYNIIQIRNETEAIKYSPNAEIILGHRYLRQSLPFAKKIKWVQASGGGYDHLPWEILKKNNVKLTRITFNSTIIGAHAVMLALALNRKLSDCFSAQKQRYWADNIYSLLHPRPKKALIIGFGAIGKSIAKILQSMNIIVWGVKRRGDEMSKKLADRLFLDDTWKNNLNEIDFCFLALPNKKNTKNILSAELLNKFSRDTIIVNVARDDLLDTKELCKLLNKGKIGGAGLDVFEDRKHLSKNSYIWDTKNLIVTPYLAARYKDRGKDLEKFVESQVKKYFNNEILENLIKF